MALPLMIGQPSLIRLPSRCWASCRTLLQPLPPSNGRAWLRPFADGVTGVLGARVMLLEGQVAGVAHGDMLKSMFQEQMSKIEELMAPKRARQE